MNESEPRTAGQSHSGGERVVYVMPSEAMIGYAGDEVDVGELWSILWDDRWLVAGITALLALAGLTYALLAAEWYRAEVLLAPVQERSKLGLISQLGGLANLAGISTGGDGSAEPVAVLKSRDLAREFIEDLNLIPVLFADDWDAAEKSWRAKNSDDWPDIRDAVTFFQRNVCSVSQDRKTGQVTLAIEWTDPEMASAWANQLVKRLNDRMRERALTESERNVHYLQQEIASTNVVSLQQSIGRLLESELQKLMLARGNEEFSFRVIDRATPPKYREKPKRLLIVLLAAIVGGIVAVIASLIRHSWASRSATMRST